WMAELSLLLFADRRLLLHGPPTTQLHAVVVVDVDHQHPHPVSHSANIRHTTHVLVGQFADVAETIATGQDFDERTKVLDAGHTAFVDLPDLDRRRQGLD